jgi:hypothetical protein
MDNKTLYVVFMDLTNMFPSTDQPTLWLRLLRRGAGGPLIDLLKVLYERMRYMVRNGDEFSDPFLAQTAAS